MLAAGEIVLRRDSHEVTVAGEDVELTSKEFDLLACFLEHRGIVLSRERLLDIVWGVSYPGGTRTVDMHVAQLRRQARACRSSIRTDPRRRATSCWPRETPSCGACAHGCSPRSR